MRVGKKTIEVGKIDAKTGLLTETIELDAPVAVIGGRAMLPLRGVSELFGKSVTWFEKGLIVAGSARGGEWHLAFHENTPLLTAF